MKATELRIGNWVKRDEHPDGFQIDSRSFIVCERDPEMYQPIPLTEEWLVRFGFEWDDIATHTDGRSEKMLFKVPLLMQRFQESKRWIACVWGYIGNVERTLYVHQLQNLYFALTGQELEIQNPK